MAINGGCLPGKHQRHQRNNWQIYLQRTLIEGGALSICNNAFKRAKGVQRKCPCPVIQIGSIILTYESFPRCVFSCCFPFVDVCTTLLGCHPNPEASLRDPFRRVSMSSVLVLRYERVQIRSKSFIAGQKRCVFSLCCVIFCCLCRWKCLVPQGLCHLLREVAIIDVVMFFPFSGKEKLKKPRRCTSFMSAGLLKLSSDW